jgi:hypothetical protein
MKNYLILIGGIILLVMGFLTIAFAFPSAIEVDLTFAYVGFGLVIFGGLMSAFWFVSKLRGDGNFTRRR